LASGCYFDFIVSSPKLVHKSSSSMIFIVFHTFFKDVYEVIFFNYLHAIIADPLYKRITIVL